MSKPHILVVDDRANMLHLLQKVLREDATVHTAGSGSEAVTILEGRAVSAVVCDLRMPDMSGIDVLRASKRLQPGAEFVLMTAYATVPTAVEAMREGAYDYVTKPFDPDSLRATVLRALSRASTQTIQTPGVLEQSMEVLPGLLGCSQPIKELGEQVRRVTETDATVLVSRETGTEKGGEAISRALEGLNADGWPGDVRQLRCAIEQASIEAGPDTVDVQHLPPEIPASGPSELSSNLVSMKWHEAMALGRRETGRQYLQAVLKRYAGRIAEAAVHAGVERESFYRLLRRYGVQLDGNSVEREE